MMNDLENYPNIQRALSAIKGSKNFDQYQTALKYAKFAIVNDISPMSKKPKDLIEAEYKRRIILDFLYKMNAPDDYVNEFCEN